jgi:hypothetical protein
MQEVFLAQFALSFSIAACHLAHRHGDPQFRDPWFRIKPRQELTPAEEALGTWNSNLSRSWREQDYMAEGD